MTEALEQGRKLIEASRQGDLLQVMPYQVLQHGSL